jgi:hypothetical protein
VPEPRLPHQAQAQGLWHVEEFHWLGSLTRGMEVDEVPDEGDMTPFLREDMVMIICDGRPRRGYAACLT